MNVDKEIEELQEKAKGIGRRIRWLRDHKAQLAKTGATVGALCGDQLDFDNLPHAEIIKVIRALGGKWKKSRSAAGEHRIDYETTIDGMRVRCWRGQPPPSCRLVEVEEVIPAQPARVVKKFKMVCKPDLAADIAIARGVPAGSPASTPEESGGAA